jgi:hypothetical protein
MRRMGVNDQIKSAFQDLIAPELQELRGDIDIRERLDALEARRQP